MIKILQKDNLSNAEKLGHCEVIRVTTNNIKESLNAAIQISLFPRGRGISWGSGHERTYTELSLYVKTRK